MNSSQPQKNLFQDPWLSRNIIEAIRWLVSQQNRDGSWGKSEYEKITWTSQIVIALTYYVPNWSDFYPLKQAVSFLKKLRRRNNKWYFRIPALLYVKDHELLKDDLASLEKEIDDGEIELRFQASLAIDLITHGINLDFFYEIETSLLKKLKSNNIGFSWFSERTDEDLLYALAIVKIDDLNQDITEEFNIEHVINWVLSRKTRNSDSVNWENSYGRTAYITINLLMLEKAGKVDLDKMLIDCSVDEIFSWFKPLKDGRMPEDTQPAVFKSTHSIYITALYLRMIGMFIDCKPLKGNHILKTIVGRLILEMKKKWVLKKIVYSSIMVLSTFILVFLFTYFSFGKDAFVSLIISLSGALLLLFVDILFRNVIINS